MAFGSTSNWVKETEQEIFEKSKGWKKVRYFTPEPQKEPLYILLKCKDCKKKLSSMEKRNMKLAPATFARHAIENDLDSQKKVENEITHFVLHVETYYQKNTTGMML
ncbi:hypothetical protein G9A89_018357 [Geosiphon pyriformis]|nr:hypothetical protein G9A89_018357 [Geosiphon pyriformis]